MFRSAVEIAEDGTTEGVEDGTTEEVVDGITTIEFSRIIMAEATVVDGTIIMDGAITTMVGITIAAIVFHAREVGTAIITLVEILGGITISTIITDGTTMTLGVCSIGERNNCKKLSFI